MGRLTRGYDEAVEQMQQVAEDETMAMEHKIGYRADCLIAPMLGLLGTVQGMVMSFGDCQFRDLAQTVGTRGRDCHRVVHDTGRADRRNPAIIFYSLYKNRLARFLMECGFVAENLMKNFQNAGKQRLLPRQVVQVEQPCGSPVGSSKRVVDSRIRAFVAVNVSVRKLSVG